MPEVMQGATVVRSSPHSSKSRENKTTTSSPHSSQMVLPDLKSSDEAWDKVKPLPTSLQSDFIPEEVLFALTQPPPGSNELLGPTTRNRNLATSNVIARRPAAGVWNYPKRREKFKHLTQNTPCACGAGKDISFLYDVPKQETAAPKPEPGDRSVIRADDMPERKPVLQLPDTLLPEEYHVVKNKGVMGLEYHEDKFATQPEDHAKHLVMFPSMKPTSRYEVIQLKKTMHAMLDKLGMDNENKELTGATQMHNLLELIKKEQNIYNIIFHELIRQTSIECLERGELLAEMRDRYSQLLNRVPRQVKSLHEEVLAQRALDRRLTEELMRFKSTIGILTGQLSEVKEHDKVVTQEANSAQDNLKQALLESQKNTGLLAEYHDLYELQRKRLEKQVTILAEEKEVWSTAAYSLALKVTEEHSLNTAKRLHVSEKSWAKLANHFTILLSDNDTETLTKLQGYVDGWRDLVEQFHVQIKQREDDMRKSLNAVKAGIQDWVKDFQRHVFDREGHFLKGPDREKTTLLYTNLKSFEELLSGENEKFGGDTLLSGQDDLNNIRHMTDGWTDCALQVFNRHRGEAGENYPDHEQMLKMNEEVEMLLKQYQVRLTGENGVATGLIHVANSMENWDQKFNTMLHGSNPLPDQDWSRFFQVMDDWVVSLDDTLTAVGSTQKEDDKNENRPHRSVELSEVMKLTQKWLSSANNGIDSEDSKLVEQVSTLHTEMVKWMVQILLRLAPDRKEQSKEAKEAALVGSATIGELQSNAKSLFLRLQQFSIYVTQCCNGIVLQLMQEKRDRHEDDADHEYRDLLKLRSECDEWVRTAKMLISELTGEPFPETPAVPSEAPPSLVKVDEEGNQPQPDADQELTRETTALTEGDVSLNMSPYPVTPGGEIQHPGDEQADQEEDPAPPTPAPVKEATPAATPASALLMFAPPSSAPLPKPPGTPALPPGTPAKPPGTPAQPLGTPAKPPGTPALPPSTSAKPPGTPAQPSETPAQQVAGTPAQQVPGIPQETPGGSASVQAADNLSTLQAASEEEQQRVTPEGTDKIEIIGSDANTHIAKLRHKPGAPPSFSRPQSKTATGSRPETPNTKKAYEALSALAGLQSQLISTEERAQVAEQHAAEVEAKLKEATERIKVLERRAGPSPEPSNMESQKPKSASSSKSTEKAAPEKTEEKTTADGKEREKSAGKKGRVKSGKSKK